MFYSLILYTESKERDSYTNIYHSTYENRIVVYIQWIIDCRNRILLVLAAYIKEHGDLLLIRKPNNNHKTEYSGSPNIYEENYR